MDFAPHMIGRIFYFLLVLLLENNSCCHNILWIMQGPYLNSSRTHLQRSLGDDNVLTVKFLENEDYPAGKIIEEGLIVGLRRYRFFGDYSIYVSRLILLFCIIFQIRIFSITWNI